MGSLPIFKIYNFLAAILEYFPWLLSLEKCKPEQG